jgi:hypothetical protein
MELVERLIPRPSFTMVYSPPGGFKSAYLADMAICVSAGLPYLQAGPSDHGRSTIKVPVLWADFDNGVDETHARFEAFARGRNLTPDGIPLFYTSMASPWLDAGRIDLMESLSNRVQARGVKLVIIDNFRTVWVPPMKISRRSVSS